MEIYVVYGGFNYLEDGMNENLGVFDSEEKANNYIKQLEEKGAVSKMTNFYFNYYFFEKFELNKINFS